MNKTKKATFLGFVNEITKYLDSHTVEKTMMENGMYNYISESSEENGKPSVLEINDEEYIWYIRFPGYTSGNIIFNKADNTVKGIVLTRRGGGFSGGHETVYDDPIKIEKYLNETYKGKTLTYESDYEYHKELKEERNNNE